MTDVIYIRRRAWGLRLLSHRHVHESPSARHHERRVLVVWGRLAVDARECFCPTCTGWPLTDKLMMFQIAFHAGARM